MDPPTAAPGDEPPPLPDQEVVPGNAPYGRSPFQTSAEAPREYGPSAPVRATMVAHRGTLILVLAIAGFFCCWPCSLVAWIIGHYDLRQMDAGTMDPSGRSTTQTGKIIGMIGVIIGCLVVITMAVIAVTFYGGLAFMMGSGK